MVSPIPEIYVLWHSRCSAGETLAKRIHAWLRPGAGLGPQVFYRCLPDPDPGPPKRGLPPLLPGEDRLVAQASIPRPDVSHRSNLQILVPLIDSNLIADPLWREWLRRLGENSPDWRVALPVAIDGTAYNVAGNFRNFNFLRPAGGLSPASGNSAELEAGIRSVLKQLTESLCRLMLDSVAADESPEKRLAPKLKVFLSHAKVDGTGPAQALRNYIYGNTQLAAFYDENDIGYGRSFAQVIEDALAARETAGMIAVRSLMYATRPWCRRELSLFRKPRRKTDKTALVQRWDLHALLALEALGCNGETRGIPELGNAPCLRWDDDCDPASRAELVVTTLIRNVMLGAFHSALGDEIAANTLPGRIVINWVPDPVTLLHLPELRDRDKEIDLVYPGQGLSGLELDILWELFPHVTCHSYEEVLS